MADADFVASLAETVSALGLEKIPDKLHCNACHKFNLNAYKTTCCDTVICEPCFTSHSDISCPICDHKPFNSDVCKPNKAMRTTVKSYLKTIEKAKAETKIAIPPAGDDPVQPDQTNTITNGQEEANGSVFTTKDSGPPNEEERETTPAIDIQPSIEDPDQDTYEPDDDHVEIQVEAEEDQDDIPSQNKIVIEDSTEDQYGAGLESHNNSKSTLSNGQDQAAANGMDGNDFANMMNGFNNMDYNQMMQMMAANGMGNFNPMMGLPMGMNTMPSGMFNGFGGPNGGMNGMNSMDMGMNFNPNQGMYSGWNNGQNNNMWQNNNANAFSNGIGGDFGSNYGFNMAQSGSFQQQYPNGDFQNGYSGRGYGRGRGRGRGGYGRGRGNFNQYSQFQQQHSSGLNQYDNQGTRSQHTNDYKSETLVNESSNTHDATNGHEDDEFAPGGQDDIQEALGEDYQKSTTNSDQKAPDPLPGTGDDTHQERRSANELGDKDDPEGNDSSMQEDGPPPMSIPTVVTDDTSPSSEQPRPIPAAYEEDLQGPMPPPSAPLGPAAQYDYGYRSRGHGRFAQRGRGLLSMQNGHPAPQVKPSPQMSQATPGVVGAPTGPRAMREPPAPSRPASRPASVGNGIQIMGRASMDSPKRPESRGLETTPTVKTPAPTEHDDSRERDDSGRNSRQENPSSSKYGIDEHDSDDRDKERDRRYRRSSKRSTYDDYDRDERQTSIGASDSAERRSSRRNRADKERTSPSSKHQSSRSRAYHEEDTNGDYEMEDHESSSRSKRDGHDGGESRSRHRSSRTSKYDDRVRDRDRDREHDRDKDKARDRDRDRDRDKDRGREDRHREKEKERDRKRSRHDRHREDDKDYDKDYDYQNDDDQEARHRARRHKRDHHRRHENDDFSSTAVTSTNRSHRSSAAGTPAPVASAPSHSADKDPHTLEREARNRERMLKEQQRREKAAAKGGSSSGGAGGNAGGGGGEHHHHSSRSSRRVTYKYEDDIERSLAENERFSTRWR